MTGVTPMSAVAAVLLKAFQPGDGSTVRSICERMWQAGVKGERITLQFDLPGDIAKIRAAQLSRHADAVGSGLQLGALNKVLADVTAWVNAAGVFTVDALVLDA